jgi:hypothetical protein
MYPKELDENGLIKKLSFVYRDHIVPETTELLINPYDLQGENFTKETLKNGRYGCIMSIPSDF